MESRTWKVVDKSGWGHGAWLNEPDKAQWIDEATGLPCLIVRNSGGALCGYVGVYPDHPLHGKDYNERFAIPSGFNDRVVDDRTAIVAMFCESANKDGQVGIDLALDVHGGVTFSRGCAKITQESYEAVRARVPEREREAAKYPVGDSARWLSDWVPALATFETYKARCEAVTICHVDSDPREVWWFGFDCAHIGDVVPAYDHRYGQDPSSWYKDIEYVKREVAGLAKQLAEWPR